MREVAEKVAGGCLQDILFSMQTDTITLYPPRLAWIGVLLTCVAFLGVGLVTDLRHKWIAIPWDLLWAAGTVACIAQLTSRRDYLRLSREGFVVRSLFRTTSIFRWQDVSEFRAAPSSPDGKLIVVFDCPSHSQLLLASPDRTVAGASHGLPDHYQMSAQALAELMNKWRSQAMR
jgi:hypothetical protein